jgi:hypothetical protein
MRRGASGRAPFVLSACHHHPFPHASLPFSLLDAPRVYYGFSVLHCLSVGLVREDAAGTGTVMRADTVKRYAEEAGFAAFEVLPIENDFYRFYRLVP